jgi:hypothetical protein
MRVSDINLMAYLGKIISEQVSDINLMAYLGRNISE